MADPPSVPFVGLTGGMGAGKSTALAALAEMGAAVLSADAVVHELYENDPQLRDALVARWGDRIAPGGVVDRAAVAARAFESPEERRWLEGLLWPLVGQRIAMWLQEVRATAPPPRAAVVEIPLLFEAGMSDIFDATLAVVADEPLRRERAAGRGHALADERHARQLTQNEKALMATFTVHNDGTREQLAAKLSDILGKLEG